MKKKRKKRDSHCNLDVFRVAFWACASVSEPAVLPAYDELRNDQKVLT